MRQLRFRIVNVFTVGDDKLSGNPLCVFEDARGLSDAEMQSLARQMNLSETTFVLPSTVAADARVRIFTPTFEMPFAGHPTLGTAHVVRQLSQGSDALVLEMKAGRVEVSFANGAWTLRAARPPETRAHDATNDAIAAMIGVRADAVSARPLWVDTGAEQLVIPLATPEDVRNARPNAELLAKHGFSEKRGASMAYVFAKSSEDDVVARFFFLVHGGVVEDPATGSACANLGGYLLATSAPLPVSLRVRQGDAVGRPSALRLHVDESRAIFVSGEVIELGHGVVEL
jgi:PhzF family phenazine biosynthesis protein